MNCDDLVRLVNTVLSKKGGEQVEVPPEVEEGDELMETEEITPENMGDLETEADIEERTIMEGTPSDDDEEGEETLEVEPALDADGNPIESESSGEPEASGKLQRPSARTTNTASRKKTPPRRR